MVVKQHKSHWVKIYIAGDIKNVENVCREFCLNEGLCVTVDPTKFIYTGGEEEGVVVGLVNYPRFPKDPSEITDTAEKLALQILERTFQHSVLIMDPYMSKWFTKREQ